MSNKLEEARKIINETDKEMAELFVRRMKAVKAVFEYKKEQGLPIMDKKREEEVIARNSELVEDKLLKEYYIQFLNNLMTVSKNYQYRMQMNLKSDSYDILVTRGLISKAKEHLNLDRKVLILTDSGVPGEYAKSIKEQAKDGFIYTIKEGEDSKSLDSFRAILSTMLEKGFTRKDCVVAIGGGVVGDLAGFVAASFMRGIDFYNIPTTFLSQIDSSIGGKTAINLGGVKNIVGAFYQPKRVLIDPDLLNSLPKRQFSNGLAEAIKMSLTSDKDLFELIEKGSLEENLEEIIISSLNIKRQVVEEDEKEAGIRKVLNFGHTLGHGIEVTTDLYHGESVAVGMLPFLDKDLRPRVIETLKKYGLYTLKSYDWEKIETAISHDKKAEEREISVILVNEIGSFEIEKMETSKIIEKAKEVLG